MLFFLAVVFFVLFMIDGKGNPYGWLALIFYITHLTLLGIS